VFLFVLKISNDFLQYEKGGYYQVKLEYFGQSINYSKNINTVFEQIKNGDSVLREKFITAYKPYILKTISYLLGKYVDESNEEYSIGLSAFNEAIDLYDKNKNSNFFKYAEIVIKHRIIDFIRVNKKFLKDVPFSYFEDDEVFENRYLIYDSVIQYEKIEIKEEISLFGRQLKEFGITMEELVECSPKHKDSRSLCMHIAKIIAENEVLLNKMIKKRMLPLSDLMKFVNVHKRTVERNRKYIIAVTLILGSNLEEIKDFFTNEHKGGDFQ
jgi:RNA polymerase sigma factor